ncbi:glycosyltransferase [bacterium D16-34]|nr:glycosyltransferase [bacterium D16-34]
MLMSSPSPKLQGVTVICASYNHEAYIRDALEGFVRQKTTFPFQAFVTDDVSSDNTASIIREYAEKYPDIIVPFLHDENVGAGRSWREMINHANTTYIAFCDGDDYWTDPLKAQKQFDYMEAHQNMRACFHDVAISIETADGTWFQSKDYCHTKDGSLRYPSGHRRFIKKPSYKLENFIPFGFVHTSSMFLRWDYSIEFPDWYFDKGVGDFPMWALQVNTGRFGYLDEVMSVHRRTDSGSYAFANKYEFWQRSKNGWVDLDEGMIDFFTNTKPSKSIVAALRARENDDLAKLIKGTAECCTKEELVTILTRRASEIKSLYGIVVPQSLTAETLPDVYQKIALAAPLPPYNQTLSTRIRRTGQILATIWRTVK